MFQQLISPRDLPAPPPRERKVKAKRHSKYEPIENPWKLSPGQCTILVSLCRGWTVTEVAKMLGLSHKTVSGQIRRACETMQARHTMHACLLWDRQFRS